MWKLERNYQQHVELLQKGSQCKGCIRMPILPFPVHHYPPDMLHLKKGIISKLVNQLVEWSILQGREQYLMSEMKKHSIPFV